MGRGQGARYVRTSQRTSILVTCLVIFFLVLGIAAVLGTRPSIRLAILVKIDHTEACFEPVRHRRYDTLRGCHRQARDAVVQGGLEEGSLVLVSIRPNGELALVREPRANELLSTSER